MNSNTNLPNDQRHWRKISLSQQPFTFLCCTPDLCFIRSLCPNLRSHVLFIPVSFWQFSNQGLSLKLEFLSIRYASKATLGAPLVGVYG